MRRLENKILRRVWTGQFKQVSCEHIGSVQDVQPETDTCRAYEALGDTWPALRMCMTCGHVGCCDKAKIQHALKHFQATGHPIAKPYREFGMNWLWCYVDHALLDPLPQGTT
jgi:CPA2 family monovalent cation:H+ antiporter-2